MMDYNEQIRSEDPEIELLKEILPKLSGKNRAFLKGSAQALLYVQESQNFLVCGNCDEFTSAAL